MTRTIYMRITMIFASILMLLGVSLMLWMLTTETERNNIEISSEADLSGGKTEVIEFNSLRLVPGSECEYEIKLKNDNAKQYDLILDFVEKEEKNLKNFARVKVISGTEVICDELLADAFEQDTIVLPIDFTKSKNTKIKVVYYLPIEVGNEAKKAEAEFELRLTASNE